MLARRVLQHAAEDVQGGGCAPLRGSSDGLLLFLRVRHGGRILHVGGGLLDSNYPLAPIMQPGSGLHRGSPRSLLPRGKLFGYQFFWLHPHKFCQGDFFTQNTMEEPLVLGVLQIEHDTAVLALVAVVCDLEQAEHLLLDVQRDLAHLTLRHDQVVAVIHPLPQNLLQGAPYVLPYL